MTTNVVAEASPRPDIAILDGSDLAFALSMGWRDFRRAPGIGLVFSAVYVLGGLFLAFISGGFVMQTVILALGFPLVAPFVAVGLYETSRRIESGAPLDLYQIFGVVWNEKNRQIPWVGAIIVFYFLFYSFFAHMLFALFMGLSVMTNVSSSWDVFLTANGLTMIAVELAVGAVLGFILFGLTVFSLPLLVDKEIDFMTAMLLSFEAVRENLAVMLLWAIVIAVYLVVSMIPAFLGLFVSLPVLGHATWHLYRRALIHPEDVAESSEIAASA
ncbi:DUF2189 domain-containing protein [Tropicimonas isoalkanivorans]|uniref:Uncharacterized membrane protein n=1 Tax=Tropicimonas isoalkanivorans TaxID=441112 RepID=A0A1I1E4F3_9RHOB|nr:DUF2189 domain-containing protein [Tropicimonas isoalkanivorans]SFB81546.1 Uncharacterized membrane protein [Tropicimonas isoalkanivorans]